MDFTFDEFTLCSWSRESAVLPLQEGSVRNKLTSRVRNFHFLNVWFSSFDMLMVDFFLYRESSVCAAAVLRGWDGKRSEMSLVSFSSFLRFFESSFWVSTAHTSHTTLWPHIFDFGSQFLWKKKIKKIKECESKTNVSYIFTSWFNRSKYRNVSFNHFL